MGRLLLFANEKPLSKPLILVALQIFVVSALFSFYDVEFPIRPAFDWIGQKLIKMPFIRNSIRTIQNWLGPYLQFAAKTTTKHNHPAGTKSETNLKEGDHEHEVQDFPVFTPDQLALFDGTRQSKPVYLAILGRVFNVDKGRKHYGQGGGYHFFAGKDATRAFVTGDFSAGGLTADVTGLLENELLGISDWIAFYEKDYQFVGYLAGLYYNQKGRPTEMLREVERRMEDAKLWKRKQAGEAEVFPPCNSEWKKGIGGRVWCSNKSGGVARDWVGVPRKMYNPVSSKQQHRCVCVKNFGSSLSAPDSQTNRGDLDNPNLAEYEDCPPTANSCKIAA